MARIHVMDIGIPIETHVWSHRSSPCRRSVKLAFLVGKWASGQWAVGGPMARPGRVRVRRRRAGSTRYPLRWRRPAVARADLKVAGTRAARDHISATWLQANLPTYELDPPSPIHPPSSTCTHTNSSSQHPFIRFLPVPAPRPSSHTLKVV